MSVGSENGCSPEGRAADGKSAGVGSNPTSDARRNSCLNTARRMTLDGLAGFEPGHPFSEPTAHHPRGQRHPVRISKPLVEGSPSYPPPNL